MNQRYKSLFSKKGVELKILAVLLYFRFSLKNKSVFLPLFEEISH